MNQKLLFDIIIPSWNQSKLAIQCLQSIKKHSHSYRVIFVDNASKKEEFDKIYKVLETMPYILIKNEKNEGFVKATNKGLETSTAPYIVFMNNDTEAVPKWLDELRIPLDKDRRIGLVGPLTTTKNSWQGKYKIGQKGVEVLRKNMMLAFFCTMMRRDVYEKIGNLDEDFGVGFGDDDMYCWRAHQAGYRLALTKNIVIPHHHRSTFKKIYTNTEIKNMQEEAIRILRKKRG